MGIFVKGKHKAAYRGNLNCPVCKSNAIRYLENIGQYRLRYRCRKCGLAFQYDISNNLLAHPYAPFKNQKFQDIVAMSKGRTK